MTIEKEVVVRLRVPQGRQEGKAFETFAAQAKQLDKEAKSAGKSVTELLHTMREDKGAKAHLDRITSGLKQLGVEAKATREAANRLLKDVRDGATVGQRDIERLAAGLHKLGRGSPGMFAAARGMGGNMMNSLMTGKGMASLVGATLGGADLALDFIQRTHRPGATFLGQQHRGEMRDESLRMIGNVPIARMYMRTEIDAVKARDREIAERRGMIGKTEQRLGHEMNFRAKERELRESAAGATDFVSIMPRANQAAEQRSRELRVQSELAQDRARMAGRDPREVAARFALKESQAVLGVRQGAELEGFDRRRGRTVREVEAARLNLAAARHDAQVAKDSLPQSTFTRDRMGRWQENEPSGPRVREANLILEQKIAAVQAREAELLAVQGKLLDQNNEKQRLLVQHGEQRKAQLDQERERLTAIIATEKDRLKSAAQRFGELLPHERREAIRVAEKSSSGQDLNRSEIEFAKRLPGMEGLLGQQFEKQAYASGFGRFAGDTATQLDRPMREAEARRQVAIEQNIDVNLKLDAVSLTQQLVDQLLPGIHQAIADVTQELQTQLARERINARNQELSTGGDF